MTARQYTKRVLDMLDDGYLDPTKLAEDLLGWLSESDVEAFYKAYELGTYLYDEEELEDAD